MTTLPVSVFIIALNEGDRIAASIQSALSWADEVIVIDSGSQDDTVAASEAAGAYVLFNQWKGYGAQKRFGEDQCRNDWILNIDADEVVTPQLAAEIRALFANGEPKHSGYWLDIVEILPGQKNPNRFSHRVHAIRFYNRKFARFRDSTVHDSVVIEQGSAGKLSGILEHRSSRGLKHSIDKLNRYTTMQAENMLAGHTALYFPILRLIVEFPSSFFKAYILRGYVLQGRAGLVNAMLYGFNRFMRVAKYLEMRNKE